ncbi:retrovirus-related pol polyprotein from transposon TNT 1-94, partial [Tanacetum coccineum]
MITYLKNQGGYKESYFKKIGYDDIRPIFKRVWDHVNTFTPIGSEVEKDSSKPSERETSKTVEEEKVEEENVNPEPVLIEKKAVGIRRKTLERRRASDKQGLDSSKRQKKEKETADYEDEKDELRMWLTIVPDEEAIVNPKVLHTKLVMERFQDNTPGGYNLMLWGDLKILVDPEKDNDIWKNQNQWKIISWKLYETCGVHTLMVDGIKREFSIARTPQQNGVAERKNRTLIEAARTMLADSLLSIPFWAEAFNTACYVLNRCPLTILNTLDSLGKFDRKSDEGYLLGYSTSSKAFRVYNKRTKRVEENLHINFLEDQPNMVGTSPNWMFDLDFLTNSMNYIPISVENQVIVDAGTKDSYVAGSSGKDKGPTQEYILLALQPHRTRIPAKDVVQDAQAQTSENA